MLIIVEKKTLTVDEFSEITVEILGNQRRSFAAAKALATFSGTK